MAIESTPTTGRTGSPTPAFGSEITTPPEISETRAAAALVNDIGFHRSKVKILNEDAEQLHSESHYYEWNTRTNERGKESPSDLLEELGSLGFAWRDIARLIGVSVPSIQKWRRGERITGSNRRNLAALLAGCDLIAEHYGVKEIASWFEMPIIAEVPATPIDLWTADRPDLVFSVASGHADLDQVLNSWDPGWRETYRSDFEVFKAADGERSIRVKSR